MKLTPELREKLRRGIEEWKYLLFKPEYQLGCDSNYGEVPSDKYPMIFYRKKLKDVRDK